MDGEDGFLLAADGKAASINSATLVYKSWKREGDKFVPFGMTGKKNVSDYLTDRKFSLFEKENQYVVCSRQATSFSLGIIKSSDKSSVLMQSCGVGSVVLSMVLV